MICLFSLACEAPLYAEKEIKIVIAKPRAGKETEPSKTYRDSAVSSGVSASDHTPIETVTELEEPKPLPSPSNEAVKKGLKQRLEEVEKLIQSKRLTLDDLVMLVPGASMAKLSEEIDQDKLDVAGSKISELRQAVEWVTIDQGFVSEKLSRTRGLMEKTSLEEGKAEELRASLNGVSVLIKEEQFSIANETLSSIQEELSKITPPPMAGTQTK